MKTRVKSWVLQKFSIRENVKVGHRFHVGPGSVLWAPQSLEIGNDVYVGKNVTIEVDGLIGDGVLIANLVGIVGRQDHDKYQIGTNIRRSRWVADHPEDLSEATVIGSDVWLGYGAIILSGVSIGESSIVAAGSVVTKDIPPNSVVAGNPARIIGKRFNEFDFREHWVQLKNTGSRVFVGLEDSPK